MASVVLIAACLGLFALSVALLLESQWGCRHSRQCKLIRWLTDV